MHSSKSQLIQLIVSLILGGGIMWWMYRGFSAAELTDALRNDIRWEWMIASLPFGILACWFRAMRWRQLMQPLGVSMRRHVASSAIFISYASSLVVPRIGEVLRCAILRRYEGASFAQSVGTVVTERAIDSVLLVLLTLVTILSQIDVFTSFVARTGMGMRPIFASFTPAGWVVTAICVVAIVALTSWLLHRLSLYSRAKTVVTDLRSGLLSVRSVQGKTRFWFYSVGIWAAYFLHFYVAFFCFEPTSHMAPMAALAAFVVGSFAVLVPTPNGAGAWHFATKTILMIYGIASAPAAVFVLVVHTIQTLLVALLGLYALVALQLTPMHNSSMHNAQCTMHN